jgi:hypothetical protein
MSLEDVDSGIRHIQRLLALAESLRALGTSVYHHELARNRDGQLVTYGWHATS